MVLPAVIQHLFYTARGRFSIGKDYLQGQSKKVDVNFDNKYSTGILTFHIIRIDFAQIRELLMVLRLFATEPVRSFGIFVCLGFWDFVY
jgi:hypothetical protein